MRTAGLALAYAAALGLGLYATFGPTFESGFARVQTERGDGMLNHYILEHTWQSIANPDYRGSLFSPPCFYPTPHTLWYSEHFLGVAPVYWGLRLVLPYDLAYQWWQILLGALNFVAFAAVIRWLRAPHALAILGGYLWAFGLVHVEQIKHQQMIPRFCMALAAYHAWMFVLGSAERGTRNAERSSAERGTRNTEPKAQEGERGESSDFNSALRAPRSALSHLNRMLAAVFVQAITCVNTGWFLVAGLATFLPLALSLCPGGWRDLFRFVRQHRWRVALVVGGWAAAMAIAYVPYLVVNWGQGRTYEESYMLVPRPEAWFAAPAGTVWEGVIAPYRESVHDECWLFCGYGVYALVLAAGLHVLATLIRKGRRPEFGLIAAGLLTAVAWVGITLTDEDGGHSLWEFVRYIPGGTAIRCVSRVYVLVYLFGTLAALVWLARVTESLRPPVRCAVLGLITAACVVEQLGCYQRSFDKPDFYAIVDRAAAEAKKGDIAYVIPRYTDRHGHTGEWVYGEVIGMWVGLRANVPVVNGYSGRVPGVVNGATYPSLRVSTDDEVRWWLLAHGFRGRLAVVDPDNPAATRVIVFE